MKKIDGQISTQKVENVFSDNFHSKEQMLSVDKEHKRVIFNEESMTTSKLSGKFFSRKDTEQFPKTNQHYNEAKNTSSIGFNTDHSLYFEFEIRGIDKVKNIDSEDL
jgi:hypothetical protein